jgi:hypothetical protein
MLLIFLISTLLMAGNQFHNSANAGSGLPLNPSIPRLQTGKNANAANVLYLPALSSNHPWVSPFGTESYEPTVEGSEMLELAVELNVNWIRLGTQVRWDELQPNQGDPIQWHLLASFEDELRGLRSAGITPIVVIRHTPDWAVDPLARSDGQLTSCGPIATEHFVDFADFLHQLVRRYKTPEFNVHDWEIGNEPDVDPDVVPVDYGFGCWGDIDDIDYYGGERYGEMLMVVTPAIKNEDPLARVHIGGLILSNPETTTPGDGKPERFLRGILAAGAGPFFDVVPYHFHPSYWNVNADYDKAPSYWTEWGGGTAGKARYLRQLMSEYGVEKQLFLNESGFGCIGPDERTDTWWCAPPDYPDEQFFLRQADHLVRTYSRALSENLMGMIWYRLDGPGYRNSGLLDASQNPRPSYDAYKVLTSQLQYGKYHAPVDYGVEIEAYEFRRKLERVHIAWAINPTSTIDVLVPDEDFIAAYDRDGTLLDPPLISSDRRIAIGFSPIYIIRSP